MVYIVIIVDITDIIAIMNMNTSIIKLLVKKFWLQILSLIDLDHAFLSNQKFLYHIDIWQYIL